MQGRKLHAPHLLWFTAAFMQAHLLQHFKTSYAKLRTGAEVRVNSAVSSTQGRTVMFCTKGGINILKYCSKTSQNSSFRAQILALLPTPLAYIRASLLTEAVTPAVRWELNHQMSQEYYEAS